MPFDFTLPDLGEGITEAEIRKWLVMVGDTVQEHQPVVEVETDKAVVEVPTPRAGKVLSLARGEGETVRVGEVLLSIGEEGEEAKPKPRSVSVVGELPEAEEDTPTRVLATPAVRALAREKGISLEGIPGTGPRGSITREDLLSAGLKRGCCRRRDRRSGAHSLSRSASHHCPEPAQIPPDDRLCHRHGGG